MRVAWYGWNKQEEKEEELGREDKQGTERTACFGKGNKQLALKLNTVCVFLGLLSHFFFGGGGWNAG